ncbi:MAG TPA: hypothetical protein VK325_06750 [Pseudoxanthomonas sp.]|nr:hypothetical protein [Pseudoxanthomonas sp.]
MERESRDPQGNGSQPIVEPKRIQALADIDKALASCRKRRR